MLRKIILFILLFFIITPLSQDISSNEFAAYQWYMRARFHFQREEYEKAYQYVQRSLELIPDYRQSLELEKKIEDIAVWKELELKREIENIEKAREEIEKQLPVEEKIEERRDPWDEIHFNMGVRYYEKGDLNTAEQEFLKAVDLYPENVLSDYYLFLIYRRKRELYKAFERLERIAVFIRPYSLWKKLRDKGEVIQKPGLIEEIEPYFRYFPGEDFDVKIREEIKLLKTELILEKAYYEYNNLMNMKEVFRNSFRYKIIPELNSYEEDSRELDIDILYAKGLISEKYAPPENKEWKLEGRGIFAAVPEKYSEEERVERKGDILDRKEFLKYRTIADGFLDRQRYQEAILNYREALEYNTTAYDVYNKLGVIYKLQGNTEQALDMFETALEYRFDFIPALNNIATIYNDRGDYDEAVITLKKAQLIKGSDFNVHFNLGIAYQNQEKWTEALREYRIASLIRGDDPAPYIRSSVVLKNLGENELAVQSLRKALPLVENDFEMKKTVEILLEGLKKDI